MYSEHQIGEAHTVSKRRSDAYLVVPLAESGPQPSRPLDEETIFRAAIVLSIELRVTATEAKDERKRA